MNAGCIALPALLNIKQVMQQRQVSGIWNGKDELPVSKYFTAILCDIQINFWIVRLLRIENLLGGLFFMDNPFPSTQDLFWDFFI